MFSLSSILVPEEVAKISRIADAIQKDAEALMPDTSRSKYMLVLSLIMETNTDIPFSHALH